MMLSMEERKKKCAAGSLVSVVKEFGSVSDKNREKNEVTTDNLDDINALLCDLFHAATKQECRS
jgi:hypothetical protein